MIFFRFKNLVIYLSVLLGVFIFRGISFAEAPAAQEYYEKGFKLVQEKKFDEAIETFKTAVELAPNLPQVYYALGLAYFEKKENIYDAIDAFEHALDLKPDMPEPHYHLGIIYAGLVPDLELSEEHLKAAIDASPAYQPAFFTLGWIYMTQKKDPKTAIPFLEKAVELNPQHAESQYYLGLAYILSGQKHRALKPISYMKSLGLETMARALEEMTNIDPTVSRQKVLDEGEAPLEETVVPQELEEIMSQ